ncbi:MAG: GSCFA domain-containing protein [Bacteroidales bacterium]|nr:GSCFA domain-containing protein [Bacteroidales bacterium]
MDCKFHTKVDIPLFGEKYGYQNRWMFTGSCFTEHIGSKMEGLKFPADINPFGIIYNPVSVANGLRLLIKNKIFTPDDLIFQNGLWHSFYHHSRFSSPDLKLTLKKINNRMAFSREFLKKADFLFITFGTAMVYEYRLTGMTVSNCHKIPGKEFRRFRLTPTEIVDDYQNLLTEIWQINPNLRTVFTVSPIRHRQDGAVENQRSKATLLLAVDQIIKKFENEKCHYFPSYEIVMDELRDYRFYEEDMIHLSKSAINHIWEIFRDSFINDESITISQQIEKISYALNHRPFNKYTNEHLAFLNQSMQHIKEVQEKFPYLNLEIEANYFSEQLGEVKNRL